MGDRLLHVVERALLQRPLALFFDGDDVDRNVTASRGSCFRRSSTVQPSRSGRRMSSVMAAGLYLCASARAIAAAGGHQALEALFARQIQQDAREADVVFDDQHDAIAVFDLVAIVEDRGRLARQQAPCFAVERFDRRPGRFDLLALLTCVLGSPVRASLPAGT